MLYNLGPGTVKRRLPLCYPPGLRFDLDDGRIVVGRLSGMQTVMGSRERQQRNNLEKLINMRVRPLARLFGDALERPITTRGSLSRTDRVSAQCPAPD